MKLRFCISLPPLPIHTEPFRMEGGMGPPTKGGGQWLFPGPYVLLEAFSRRMTFVLEECFLVLVCVYAQLLTHKIVNREFEDTQAHTVMG